MVPVLCPPPMATLLCCCEGQHRHVPCIPCIISLNQQGHSRFFGCLLCRDIMADARIVVPRRATSARTTSARPLYPLHHKLKPTGTFTVVLECLLRRDIMADAHYCCATGRATTVRTPSARPMRARPLTSHASWLPFYGPLLMATLPYFAGPHRRGQPRHGPGRRRLGPHGLRDLAARLRAAVPQSAVARRARRRGQG
jgi:hypothetical protein